MLHLRRASRILVLVACVGLAVGGCIRTTTLSGCVTVKTPAGDPQPGAGAVVMIVPATTEFERDWAALVRSFRGEYEPARASYDAARARYQTARLSEGHALAAMRRALKSPPFTRYSVHEDAESGVRVWSNMEPPPAVWPAGQARFDASRTMADAGRRLHYLIDVHLSRAVEVIKQHRTALVNADGGGCYAIGGVPVGKVYVFANHGDRYWLRDVDAAPAPAELDFSPASPGWVFSEARRP